MKIKIKSDPKANIIHIDDVVKIVGLTRPYILQLERTNRFPKRLRPDGKLYWSKRKVFAWLRRWGIRSERK